LDHWILKFIWSFGFGAWNFNKKESYTLKYRRILTFVIFGLFMTQCHVPFAQAAPRFQFSIVYTNDVMGEVEPCG